MRRGGGARRDGGGARAGGDDGVGDGAQAEDDGGDDDEGDGFIIILFMIGLFSHPQVYCSSISYLMTVLTKQPEQQHCPSSSSRSQAAPTRH